MKVSQSWKTFWFRFAAQQCPLASEPYLWLVMTSTGCTTWVGSLSTWQPLLPAEIVRLQGELDAVKTLYLYETRLIRKPVLSFVPSLHTATVTQRFPFMEKQEKPLKTVKKLARSTTINVVTQLTEGARCQLIQKLLSHHSLSSLFQDKGKTNSKCQKVLLFFTY